ncbi:MAG: XdhC family protein [Acidobacteriota bacterium]
MNLAFHEEMVRLLRSGHTVAVATLIGRRGSAPRGAGARMIVTEAGETTFSIGGGVFEAMVIDDAREAIRRGAGFEKEYRFTETGQDAIGMVCGGTARVLFEVIRPPAPLLIFGAGHVGRELAALGTRLGFEVTVVDDRPRYLARERFPADVRLVRAEREFSGGLPPVPPGAYVAIVTRCHRTDLMAVRHAVGRWASYVGLIGSRRKVATVLARAAELGAPRDLLAQVRGPIGLPIAAQTPEEIAVSIAAEIIALRNAGPLGGRGAGLRGGPDAAPIGDRDADLPAATVTPISRGRPARRSR